VAFICCTGKAVRAEGNMATKVKIVTTFSICAVVMTALGAVAGFAARADELGAVIYNGVNELRQTCGVIGDDPRLTVAAQRHADDMLMSGVGGHIGSDGSSPQARIADAGYTRTGRTSEIVYWGTGSRATPSAALDLWMESPVHRGIILDCAFTAAGFAIARDGNKMIAVGDFAGP
jgi:uncharacterized protein YkwD